MESVGSSPWLSLRSSPVKFCVRITPYMYSTRQMYIVPGLFQRFGVYVPENIKFLLRNGDIFEGQYVVSKDCFIGLKRLLRRYREKDISFLSFEYIGRGDFVVSVLSCTAVEVEYPSYPVTKGRKVVQHTVIPQVDAFRNSEVLTVEDHLNENLLTLNASDSGGFRINIYMAHQYHEELEDRVVLQDIDERITQRWVNFGYIYFKVLDKFWKVQVRRVVGKWYFIKGWPEFARQTGVGPSDLVVLSMCPSIMCFDVAIFRDYACTPLCRDAEWPQQFLKLVNQRMIVRGEILIPRTFRSKYEHDLVKDVQIVMPSGVTYHVEFSKNPDMLTGLGPFIVANRLEEGFCLIFSMLSDSRLFVSIYDHDLVHIRM